MCTFLYIYKHAQRPGRLIDFYLSKCVHAARESQMSTFIFKNWQTAVFFIAGHAQPANKSMPRAGNLHAKTRANS